MKNYHYIFRMVAPLVLICFLVACQDEPLGRANINKDVMDEELVELILEVPDPDDSSLLKCVYFSYPFVLFLFDDQGELAELISVDSDAQFVELLQTLPEGYSISLSFPISGTLSSGELLEINTYEELADALRDCLQAIEKGRCDNNLIDCTWKVTEINSANQVYLGSYFNANYNQTMIFYDLNRAYFGTWVSLYIGDDLHLNMDFSDNPEIEAYWDQNWLVDLRSNSSIYISLDQDNVQINKDCSIACDLGKYQVCELEDTPGFGTFIFNDFLPCLGAPAGHDSVSAIQYSFFENEEDAINNANSISSTEYVNLSNPQTIFVRVDYVETETLIDISELVIEAIPCN